MPHKLIVAATIIALSAGSAQAQAVTGNVPNTGHDDGGGFNTNMIPGAGPGAVNPREQEIERQYQETLKNKIPDKKIANDPWRTVRPTKQQ